MLYILRNAKGNTMSVSTRLLLIESFVDEPPENDFQWGYLCALIEEAVDDVEEAGSDILNKALNMFKRKECVYRHWKLRQTKTLS